MALPLNPTPEDLANYRRLCEEHAAHPLFSKHKFEDDPPPPTPDKKE